MINAIDIHFTIGDHKILKGVNTQVEEGKILAICGPNGAGKSTLLRMLSGENQSSSGQVIIDDKPIHEWTTIELARKRSVLHQESYLTFPFAVEEVVRLGRFPYKNMGDNDEIVHHCLEKVGMITFKQRRYTTLSGGEKQRVHLARVLAQLEDSVSTNEKNSKILMLDEPTSALDLPHQEVTLGIASQYAKEKNYAVVIVLHDLNLAAAWADRILFLKNGRAHCEGPPEQVLTPKTIQDIYGMRTHIISHPDTNRPLVIIDRTTSTTKLNYK